MATTIKIKSTTTLGKAPTTSDIEVSELALNLADQKLYSRNSSGIFEIGKSGETPSGGTGDRPASPELGDLYFDTTLDALLYWDGSSWVPVGAGAVALNDLTDVDTTGVTNGMVVAYEQATSTWKPVEPASLSVDVDLGYTPAIDKGTVTNTAGTDAELPAATTSAAGLFVAADKQKLDGIEAGAQVNPDLGTYLQTGDNISELVNDANYATTSDIGDGKITITKADGTPVGDFTVNQAGDKSIALPAATAAETYWTEDSGKLYPTTLTNKVGIGTDEPAETLDVGGTSRFRRSDGSTQFFEAKCDANANTFSSNGGKDFYITNNEPGKQLRISLNEGGGATTKVVILPDGNFGIGLNDPAEKLHVDGHGQFGGSPHQGAANGARIEKGGLIQASRTNNSDDVWRGYKTGTTTPTSKISAQGKLFATTYDLESLPPLP